MSGDEVAWLPTLAVCAAAVLFLLEAAFAVALAAVSALSRVALRRLGTENGDRLAFLESLRETASVHRIAAHLARQLCLLGGGLLLVLGLQAAGWSHPLVTGLGIAVATTFVTAYHLFSADPIPHKSDDLYYIRLDAWDPGQPYYRDRPAAPTG